MIDLTYHSIHWCAQHGHPVLFLGCEKDNYGIGIAISVEDAQSFAVLPAATSTSRSQTYHLLESWMRAFGIHIRDVTLRLGQNGMTDTLVRLDGIRTSASIPARLADGVALAQRANAPLRMTEEDADHLRAFVSRGDATDDAATSKLPGCQDNATTSNPFRPFIESLDFDGFEDDDRSKTP